MTGAAGRTGPMPRFHVCRDFLPAGEAPGLLEWALASEGAHRTSVVRGGRYDPATRSSSSVPIDVTDPLVRPIIDRVDAEQAELLARIGIKPFEVIHTQLELTAYNDGAFFRQHMDTFTGTGEGGRTRIVSGVYYLHRQPRAFEGGELRLYPFGATAAATATATDAVAGGGKGADVTPEHNSCVFFPSWALHEVLPVRCPTRRFEDSRFAISFWLNGRV